MPEDDKKLIEYVNAEIANPFGIFNWHRIAKKMGPNFTYRQCIDRWTFFLDPTINRSPFTEEEDELLLSMVNKYSTCWAQIKKHFNARTSYALKNRYYLLRRHQIKEIEHQAELENLRSALRSAVSNSKPTPVPRAVNPNRGKEDELDKHQTSRAEPLIIEAEYQYDDFDDFSFDDIF